MMNNMQLWFRRAFLYVVFTFCFSSLSVFVSGGGFVKSSPLFSTGGKLPGGFNYLHVTKPGPGVKHVSFYLSALFSLPGLSLL